MRPSFEHLTPARGFGGLAIEANELRTRLWLDPDEAAAIDEQFGEDDAQGGLETWIAKLPFPLA
ncbi:MAG: hypothetical protein OXG37_01285 [Actinomycetia bacterium]|nr:hypothetical protein [Actinomycetes bacterium]